MGQKTEKIFERAKANFDENNHENALRLFNDQPEDDQLYQMLGSFYHNNESPQKALAQFKKSVEINDDNYISHKGLAIIYARFLNKHENAITHFGKAISLQENQPELFFNRGCSHMILQNMDAAEQDLRKAADLGDQKAKKMVKKYFA